MLDPVWGFPELQQFHAKWQGHIAPWSRLAAPNGIDETQPTMEITLTTPAILFPAISLLLLAYTNRFLAIASIVRTLVNRVEVRQDANILGQISNLQLRVRLIKAMQALGIASLFCCVLAIIQLYFGFLFIGKISFAGALFLMLGSLAVSFWEIMLSGVALRSELERVLESRQQVPHPDQPAPRDSHRNR